MIYFYYSFPYNKIQSGEKYMLTTYEQWCEKHTDIKPLIRSLQSSLPEEYIGFYLHKFFGDEIEYHAQFNRLGNSSLDIYIPSLDLAIEYDGTYYHREKRGTDAWKTSACKSEGIYLIHILEKTSSEEKSRKRNTVDYYYKKGYVNIDVAINDLLKLINKRRALSLKADVDIIRDRDDIVAYIQNKYYKKTVAYVWPEIKDYWSEEENGGITIYDFFPGDRRSFELLCPKCNKRFKLFTRYFAHSKSMPPCDCEYKNVNVAFDKALQNFKETRQGVTFDDSVESRRLYDKMEYIVEHIWKCQSLAEAELYEKSGFWSPYLPVCINLLSKNEKEEAD